MKIRQQPQHPQTPPASLESIPVEVFNKVTLDLDLMDIVSLGQTSRSLAKRIRSPSFLAKHVRGANCSLWQNLGPVENDGLFARARSDALLTKSLQKEPRILHSLGSVD